MRMIIIDNKRVPAPPPPNLDWETALNPPIPSSSARDQMKYFDKWLEIKQEEQMEDANGGVPGEQDHFLEYAAGSSDTAMAVEPPVPVNENGSHLNETARQPLFFDVPEYTPPAGTSNAFDKPTTSIVTGQEMDEEMYAEAAQWLQRSVADKSDDDAMAFLRSLLEDSSATAEDELSNGFAEPPPAKRIKTQEPPIASTSSLNQTSGSIDLPFKFRREVSNFKIRFACVEDLNFHLVGALKDRLQCKICGADFDTESFLKTHKGLCHRKSRKKVDLTCSSCRTHSCNVRLYLSHFASEKHRSLCPCSKQSLLQDKKN